MDDVTFDEAIKKSVKDPSMTTVISNFKTAHINFKSNQFAKVDEFKTFKVLDHMQCKMGKWIIEQDKNQTGFTKSTAWNELKNMHEIVHSEVQNYIDENAQKANNEELGKIAKRIEDETVSVFDELNGVLLSHCKYLK